MDYQSNSHKNKEQTAKEIVEKKKVEKVISGEVVQKNKPIRQRFRAIFFGGDFKRTMAYIAAEVLLPSARNLIVDATTKGIERAVYGESIQRRRPLDSRPRIQYNSPINRLRDPRDRAYLPDQPPIAVNRDRYDFRDIILSSREEAELVLERLSDIIDQYEVASLADLYDLVGLPTSHIDNKWGWSYLTGAAVRQVREGYLLDLPAVTPI